MDGAPHNQLCRTLSNNIDELFWSTRAYFGALHEDDDARARERVKRAIATLSRQYAGAVSSQSSVTDAEPTTWPDLCA
jgi:hypothetical protein